MVLPHPSRELQLPFFASRHRRSSLSRTGRGLTSQELGHTQARKLPFNRHIAGVFAGASHPLGQAPHPFLFFTANGHFASRMFGSLWLLRNSGPQDF